jgi:hypothetical protein
VLPVTVQDRAALAARFIGGGAVKLSPDAHDKTAAFNGVTRNHFIAHVCSYGSENATAGEFVGALCTAVLMTLADDLAVERQLADSTAQAPHEAHGPLGSVAAAGLPAPQHVPGAAEQLAARVAAYEQALEEWNRDYAVELERQRKIGGNPTWTPPGGKLRGFRPRPQDPRSTLRWL